MKGRLRESATGRIATRHNPVAYRGPMTLAPAQNLLEALRERWGGQASDACAASYPEVPAQIAIIAQGRLVIEQYLVEQAAQSF
jgi:hypothetical protein